MEKFMLEVNKYNNKTKFQHFGKSKNFCLNTLNLICFL